MPYVQCPQCEADCLVVNFSTAKRRHSCPQCGATLKVGRKRSERASALANVREAQARFKRPGSSASAG